MPQMNKSIPRPVHRRHIENNLCEFRMACNQPMAAWAADLLQANHAGHRQNVEGGLSPNRTCVLICAAATLTRRLSKVF
eukprot:6176937-Pleurochrysis_carterae.AAC.2